VTATAHTPDRGNKQPRKEGVTGVVLYAWMKGGVLVSKQDRPRLQGSLDLA
jgi:hypothetical protein